jgi:hypothetical protein
LILIRRQIRLRPINLAKRLRAHLRCQIRRRNIIFGVFEPSLLDSPDQLYFLAIGFTPVSNQSNRIIQLQANNIPELVVNLLVLCLDYTLDDLLLFVIYLILLGNGVIFQYLWHLVGKFMKLGIHDGFRDKLQNFL